MTKNRQEYKNFDISDGLDNINLMQSNRNKISCQKNLEKCIKMGVSQNHTLFKIAFVLL